MGLRLDGDCTDEKVRAYVYDRPSHVPPEDGKTIVWVFQYTYNNAGRWVSVHKTLDAQVVIDQWREVRREISAVHLERRLAYVHEGTVYLLNLVPWMKNVAFEDAQNQDENYVHVLGGAVTQPAI